MSLDELAATELDLLVVGAGIHGAFAAWDAARRGLRVGLIDRGDFGGATSANSLKIVHGGFRYLQTGDVARLRESHAARAALLALAPHLVTPLPCVVPTTSALSRGPLALGVALAAYDLLSLGAADESGAAARVPRGRVIGWNEYAHVAGAFAVAGAVGGALWYDALISSPDRLLISVVRSAARDGAIVANYVEAVKLLRAGTGRSDRVAGALVRSETGEEMELRARLTLLAASAGARTLAPGGAAALPPFARACNLVLELPGVVLPQAAVAVPVRGQRRMLFAVPWRGRLMLGTSQHEESANAPEQATAELLGALRATLPELELTAGDVRLVHHGLLPGTANALLDRPALIDHEARDGVAGVVTMLGVKWTTAIQVAARAVALCARRLGASRTAARAWLIGAESVERSGTGRLASLYGTDRDAVQRIASESPELAATLAEGVETIGAEVAFAIRVELARHLDDVVMRRTGLGAAGHPGEAALNAAAHVAARELGWNESREREEIAAVVRRFPGS